jgi:hypothetical protein
MKETVTMMELQVALDFPCCICEQSVGLTVKCEGDALWENTRSVSKVIIPCPNCSHLIHLSFEPASGSVCDVVPYVAPRGLPQPSIN